MLETSGLVKDLYGAGMQTPMIQPCAGFWMPAVLLSVGMGA